MAQHYSNVSSVSVCVNVHYNLTHNAPGRAALLLPTAERLTSVGASSLKGPLEHTWRQRYAMERVRLATRACCVRWRPWLLH